MERTFKMLDVVGGHWSLYKLTRFSNQCLHKQETLHVDILPCLTCGGYVDWDQYKTSYYRQAIEYSSEHAQAPNEHNGIPSNISDQDIVFYLCHRFDPVKKTLSNFWRSFPTEL